MTGNEPPAGTPPAEPAAGGNNQPPAQTPAPQPGTPPAQGEFILSQEQFDKRWAEKMAAPWPGSYHQKLRCKLLMTRV